MVHRTSRRPSSLPLLAAAFVAVTAALAATTGPALTQERPPSQQRAPLPDPPRTEVSGTYWNGRVVVVGGWPESGDPSPQVDFYDPGTDTWSPGPPLPVGVHHTAVAVLGDRVYVVGGFTNRPEEGWIAHDGVVSLGPGEDAWREEPSLPEPRGALAVASTGTHLVAVGGVGGTGDLRRTETLALGESKWRRGPDLRVKREHLAATAVGDRVYAIAGREFTLESNRASVESWAVGEEAWRDEPLLRHPRGGIGAATPGVACVAGGEEPEGTIAPVECLVDGRWAEVAELAVPRHGVAVVADGRRLHVIGGGPEPGLYFSDVHEVFDL